ncbi:MAG: DNA-binding response regulator, partial [Bacteroidetes bacterium]|nr:DNA-binding response regulator [Bacteroidota bacterium]
GNTLFFDRNEAISYSGDKITLTKKELQILRLLVERDGETISREEMLDLIWGVDVYPSTRTIDNFIVGFRKHFEKDPKKPLHFHSIRGVGYRFLSNPVV